MSVLIWENLVILPEGDTKAAFENSVLSAYLESPQGEPNPAFSI